MSSVVDMKSSKLYRPELQNKVKVIFSSQDIMNLAIDYSYSADILIYSAITIFFICMRQAGVYKKMLWI